MIRLKKAINGQYYYVIVAGNGAVLATSETYTTKSHAVTGINAFINAVKGISSYLDDTGE